MSGLQPRHRPRLTVRKVSRVPCARKWSDCVPGMYRCVAYNCLDIFWIEKT